MHVQPLIQVSPRQFDALADLSILYGDEPKPVPLSHLDSLSALSSLQTLAMHDCIGTEIVAATLTALTHLTALSISGTEAGAEGARDLARHLLAFTLLRRLDLDICFIRSLRPFSGVRDGVVADACPRVGVRGIGAAAETNASVGCASGAPGERSSSAPKVVDSEGTAPGLGPASCMPCGGRWGSVSVKSAREGCGGCRNGGSRPQEMSHARGVCPTVARGASGVERVDGVVPSSSVEEIRRQFWDDVAAVLQELPLDLGACVRWEAC